MKKIYHWATKQVHTSYATAIFALMSFVEGFFFVPLTAIFVLYGIEKPKRSFFYATLAIFFALAGAIVGYFIGHCTWQYCGHWINFFITPEKLAKFVARYTQNQDWTIFIFTLFPFPFKAITISAGFFHLSLSKLLLFSMAGRSIRFYSLALATFYYGKTLSQMIEKYFYLFFAIGLGLATLFIWVIAG